MSLTAFGTSCAVIAETYCERNDLVIGVVGVAANGEDDAQEEEEL